MRIKKAEFLKSAAEPSDYPPEIHPEVVFVGRSNVGKSSMINVLLSRKGLAKISSVPGKTRLINFFEVNERLYFVDLPGYGFAKAPMKVRQRWRPMIETFFRRRTAPRLIIFIVDLRRSPGEEDRNLLKWMRLKGLPVCVVATKADKISRGRRKERIERIAGALGVSIDEIIPFSALTGEGKSMIWRRIDRAYF